jgi:small subunit ribosomal protein S4
VRGNTGENLVGILESRLDAVVYRAKFAQTVFEARQIINHGHIKVNGKKVNISSYMVKENDEVEVKESSKQMAKILSAVANKEREVPEYIVADHKQMTAKFSRVPKMDEIPYPAIMEPNLVVEYYSR